MKLIHILALATAVSITAGAQNTGQPAAQPTPTPKVQGVPAAGKASPTPASASKSGVPAKSGANTAGKPAVSTGTVKDKPNQNTVKATNAQGTKTGQATPATSTKAGGASTKPGAPAKTTPATSTKTGAAPKTAPASSTAKKGPVTTTPAAAPKKGAPAPAASTVTAKPAATTSATAVKKKSAKPAQHVAAKPKVEKPKVEKPKVEKAQAPATAEKKQTRLVGAAGRRDPFVSPIRDRSNVAPTASCTSGKRCLAIPELVLQGTVRDISGKMMAVVSTSNRRTYTLRENDQVFNGSVEKITSDSIIFREYTKDAVGRESAKEVVKKLGPTS